MRGMPRHVPVASPTTGVRSNAHPVRGAVLSSSNEVKKQGERVWISSFPSSSRDPRSFRFLLRPVDRTFSDYMFGFRVDSAQGDLWFFFVRPISSSTSFFFSS
jgi:hypothetical protein